MKYLGIIIMMTVLVNVALAQTPSERPALLSNGNLEVSGLDPFGAMVTVEYNGSKEKVYQERTLNGQTTYVHFAKGLVVEYGTIVKPALVSNDNIRIDESIDP
tara:strand:- start:1325 stop:1633 length:309 start_codon:yes stop_codon:yes gene_type:complete